MEETKVVTILDYLTCRETLNKIGVPDIVIMTALNDLKMDKRSLCDEKEFKSGQEPWGKTWEFTRRGTGHFTSYKGDHEKRYMASADFYLIPAQFQGLRHGKIVHRILELMFPWFKSFEKIDYDNYTFIEERTHLSDVPERFHHLAFSEILKLVGKKVKVRKTKSKWDIYEIYGGDIEAKIYLKTEHGSLYVPIRAIVNSDWDLIDKQMREYGKSYHDPMNLSGFALNHRGRTKEEYKIDKKKDYFKMIKPLISTEAKQLKEFITKDRKEKYE